MNRFVLFSLLVCGGLLGQSALAHDQGLAISLFEPNFEYTSDLSRPFEPVTAFQNQLTVVFNEDSQKCRILAQDELRGWPCEIRTTSTQRFRGEAAHHEIRIRTTDLADLALRHINLYRPEILPLSYDALVEHFLARFVRGTHASSPSMIRFLTLERYRQFQRNQDAVCEVHTPILRDLGRSLRMVAQACQLVGPIQY